MGAGLDGAQKRGTDHHELANAAQGIEELNVFMALSTPSARHPSDIRYRTLKNAGRACIVNNAGGVSKEKKTFWARCQ